MLIEKIRKNSDEYGSIPFWSWNDKLDPEELRRQINVMKKIGMNGFFMHARGGLETDYLSDDWYDCIRQCVDEAKKLGMEAWSYDENGWPSGFAGGKLLEDKKNHATYLEYEIKDTFDSNALGVYKVTDKGIERLHNNVEGVNEYFCVYQKYDSSYVDTMDAEITKEYIRLTHEDYKKVLGEDFGVEKGMPGFFTDEPQYYRYKTPWSNILRDEFNKKYGYDILNFLPALFVTFDEEGLDWKKIRYDYHYLVHELYTNNFIKVIYDWCEENNCLLTGHTVEEARLSTQMWCCGGAMPFYEYQHIPGIDHLGRGIPADIAPKQVGSVAAQLGRKKVLSEMFGCCGWDVSPYELKKIAEWQYASGVNLMCQHLYPYSIKGQRKRDYPAFYSEHLPWQEQMTDFNVYFKRLGYVLAMGSELVNTLIIHPIHSAYLTYNRQKDMESVMELEKEFEYITNMFSQNQIAYHYGDEILMAKHAKVNDDGTLSVGLCTYEYVVLPYCQTLDSSTVELLKEFLEKGGKLYLYKGLPERIDGRKADLSFLKQTCTFEDIKDAQIIKLSKDGNNIPHLRVMTRDTEDGRIFYILNLSDEVIKDVDVEIKGRKEISVLELMDLKLKEVAGSKLSFEGGESFVLVEKASDVKADMEVREFAKSKVEGRFVFKDKVVNAINLDYAYMSYDGETYEKLMPVMQIKDLLFRRKYEGKLYLKYEFNVMEMPGALRACFEPLKYSSVKVNGMDVVVSDEWFLDRSFLVADILEFVKGGKNELVFELDYYQDDYVYYVLYGGVSESLRNCLNFDTEIESVYLYGDFSVVCDSDFTSPRKNVLEYTGQFHIARQKEDVDISDVVRDGYPFFSGKMHVAKTFNIDKVQKIELIVDGRYSVCDCYVNDKKAGRLMYKNHCDITEYIKQGENELELVFYNSQRNLLGPHHFADPEPTALGPVQFSLENMWTEDGSHAHRDRYSFVRFGADIYIGT